MMPTPLPICGPPRAGERLVEEVLVDALALGAAVLLRPGEAEPALLADLAHERAALGRVDDLRHVLPGEVEDVGVVVLVEELLDLGREGLLLGRELEIHARIIRGAVPRSTRRRPGIDGRQPRTLRGRWARCGSTIDIDERRLGAGQGRPHRPTTSTTGGRPTRCGARSSSRSTSRFALDGDRVRRHGPPALRRRVQRVPASTCGRCRRTAAAGNRVDDGAAARRPRARPAHRPADRRRAGVLRDARLPAAARVPGRSSSARWLDNDANR